MAPPQPTTFAAPEPPPISKLHARLRGKYPWALLLAVMGALAGAIWGFHQRQPLYTSTAMLRVQPVLPHILYQTDRSGIMPMYEQYFSTQVKMITSDRVLTLAVQQPEWQALNRGWNPAVQAAFLGGLTVQNPGGTELIDITFADASPYGATAGVHSILKAFLLVYHEQEQAFESERLKILADRRDDLYKQLQKFNDQIMGIAKRYGTDSLDLLSDAKFKRLDHLETMLEEVRWMLAAAEPDKQGRSAVEPVSRLSIDEIAQQDPQMADYLRSKNALVAQIQGLKIHHKNTHPMVIEANKQLAALDRTIQQYAQTYRQSKPADAVQRPWEIDGIPPIVTLTQLREREQRLKDLYQAETSIAARLHALLSIPAAPIAISVEHLLAEVESKLILCLSEEQRNVLGTIITRRIGVITGGPGTGKTTLIKSLTRMNQILGRQVCLAAPTGRAARRLAEVTGHKAHTIHKLLEYNFEEERFGKNQDNPIDADIVIVDETSMVDTLLMRHLLCAIPLNAAIILVGDAHQLPPVGPGTLLGDMIDSGRLPIFYLNTIFRQAQKSPIIVNAHRVRQGEFPQLNNLTEPPAIRAEFYFIDAPTPENVVDTVVDLCVRKLPGMFGLRPIEDIQVLTPMHKGIAGTINLNRAIQKALNNKTDGLSHHDNRFRTGDKVMHLKNNYQKEVYNGDIGVITDMDTAGGLLAVDYDGRRVEYTIDETDELTLGYAISVHKSQGSEYPAVILPLITQHYIMLQRNLLYTAITRAQKHVVIVGSQKAIHIALKNNTPEMRCSSLADRLKSMIP